MCRGASEGEWPRDSFNNGEAILLSDSQLFGVAYGGLTELRGGFTERAHKSSYGSTAHGLVPSQPCDIRALILLTSLYPASCLELFSGSLAPASYEALIKIEEVNLSHQNLADEPASQNK